MSGPVQVGVASLDDLQYIDHLQRENAEELAFYPLAVFEREVWNGRLLIARINGWPAGYLYHGAMKARCKIHQACIQYDARGYMYGAALVGWMIELARQSGVYSIHLRCGSDIAANMFWQWMGFYCEGVTQGGVRRMRDINCWRFDVVDDLFAKSVVPSAKKQDASRWRARGNVSAGSQFIRGADMADYRKKIIEGSG